MIQRFTIFIILGIFSNLMQLVAQDSLKRSIDLIAGFDIVGPIMIAFEPGQKNTELSLSMGSYNNFYVSAEGGLTFIDEQDKLYTYNASGGFFRLGFDYNIFNKNMPWESNRILIGLRYGIATLEHQANNIVVEDKFWGNLQTSFPTENVSAQWLEALVNLRAGIYKNISMGWAIKLRLITTTSGMKNVKPLTIPGYGKGNSNTSLGFTYSIYYSFPLKK